VVKSGFWKSKSRRIFLGKVRDAVVDWIKTAWSCFCPPRFREKKLGRPASLMTQGLDTMSFSLSAAAWHSSLASPLDHSAWRINRAEKPGHHERAFQPRAPPCLFRRPVGPKPIAGPDFPSIPADVFFFFARVWPAIRTKRRVTSGSF